MALVQPSISPTHCPLGRPPLSLTLTQTLTLTGGQTNGQFVERMGARTNEQFPSVYANLVNHVTSSLHLAQKPLQSFSGEFLPLFPKYFPGNWTFNFSSEYI